jgi:hypothetical protein
MQDSNSQGRKKEIFDIVIEQMSFMGLWILKKQQIRSDSFKTIY